MNSRLLFLFLYYYEERKNPRKSDWTLKDASASHADLACWRTGFGDGFQDTLLAVGYIPILDFFDHAIC